MTSNLLKQLISDLEQIAQTSTYNPKRFFKIEPGSYGAHDQFVGITNPVLRSLAKKYKDLSRADALKLLYSPYNEYRFFALLLLIAWYDKADCTEKQALYDLYFEHKNQVNNWNLVDTSAHLIVGRHVYDGLVSEIVLINLAQSPNLWHRRIAIVATWYFIRCGSLDLVQKIAIMLLNDQHDLIHKAVGWMLREMGKRDEQCLRTFLEMYGDKMSRTTYRYSIERLKDL